MNRKLFSKYLGFCVLCFTIVSCGIRREEVVYMQDIDVTNILHTDSFFKAPILTINDNLSIVISASDPTSVLPFQPLVSLTGEASSTAVKYLINSKGNIEFPIIGSLYVKGKTIQEVQVLLQNELKVYIINPVVKVNLVNFKVTLLGAVNRPGTFQIAEESISLPQALGLAGDINIKGRRDNVLIIRQINGERTIKRLNLTTTEWLNSSEYYLQPNDIVYVEPNNSATAQSGFITDYTELFRLLVTVSQAVSTIVVILRL